MKVYTKKGDKGESSFLGPGRALKSHIRFHAYGTIDELNSFIGLLRSTLTAQTEESDRLMKIQDQLFCLGSFLACTDPQLETTLPPFHADPENLEAAIDAMEENLPPLKNFILPGGGHSASLAHLARAICRRSERDLVNFFDESQTLSLDFSQKALRYINRLSDYFFVLARYLNHKESYKETLWKPKEN